MPRRGKKYLEVKKKLDSTRRYGIREALEFLQQNKIAKFDETFELAVKLGIDPRQSDQQVRSSVVLPNGLGKKVTVVVIAKGEKQIEAREAGADYVGGEDLVEKIKGGWLDFDAVIATPDMMKDVSKVGRILGPRGMMPNAKVGTATFDVAKAVRDTKAGKVEFRANKQAVVHAPFGKVSFETDKLYENLLTLLEALQKAKPTAAKGAYFRSVALSTTMGPGIKIDIASVREALESK
jgi:large subunit ribosomal protein L1